MTDDATFHILAMLSPRREMRGSFDESEHPREGDGKFAPAGGGGESKAPAISPEAGKGGVFARARAALAGKAGAVKNALKGAWQSISTPAGRTALKAKVAAAIRQEGRETKAMAATFGKMLRGEKVSPEEKKAAYTQAVDIAHKVVTAALLVGGLPPPLNHAIHAAGHAVGAGKLLSAVIHKVAHHGLDHAIEKAASKVVGKHIGLLPTAFHAAHRAVLRSEGEIDPATQAVMEALMDEIASAMEGMSEDEIADLMAEAAEPDAEQEERADGDQPRDDHGRFASGDGESMREAHSAYLKAKSDFEAASNAFHALKDKGAPLDELKQAHEKALALHQPVGNALARIDAARAREATTATSGAGDHDLGEKASLHWKAHVAHKAAAVSNRDARAEHKAAMEHHKDIALKAMEAAGREGFAKGTNAPALDPAYKKATHKLPVGGGAADLARAWNRGWTKANLEAPLPEDRASFFDEADHPRSGGKFIPKNGGEQDPDAVKATHKAIAEGRVPTGKTTAQPQRVQMTVDDKGRHVVAMHFEREMSGARAREHAEATLKGKRLPISHVEVRPGRGSQGEMGYVAHAVVKGRP